MAENENTLRSRGERLKKNEVKTEIITYILKKGVVRGPDIMKHLREEPSINIIDEKNIRIHLRDLQKQHCIEKIPHEPGLENKWIIKKIENLRNIRKHYSDIQLKDYDKSRFIIFEEQADEGYFFGDYLNYMKDFDTQLSLSNSLFAACLDKDIKTLCDEAYEYYKYGEGFEECKHIQNCIDTLYEEYIKPISVSSKTWIDIFNMNASNFSELEIYQNIIKNLPDANISEETFREILEDDYIWRLRPNEWKPRFRAEFSIKLANLVCQKMLNKIPTESKKKWEQELKAMSGYILGRMLGELPEAERITAYSDLNEEITELSTFDLILKEVFDVRNFRFISELSAKITYEIFQKMFKEIPVEFLDTSEWITILIEMLNKILHEVIQVLESLPDEMYKLLIEIMIHRRKIGLSINQIMFKHYFDKDIDDGSISSDEREYMVMMKDSRVDFENGRRSKEDSEYYVYQLYNDVIKKLMRKTGSI